MAGKSVAHWVTSDSKPVTHGVTLGSEPVTHGLTLGSEPVTHRATTGCESAMAWKPATNRATSSHEKSSYALLVLPERIEESDSKDFLRGQHSDERACAPWIKIVECAHAWSESYLSKSQWVRTSESRARTIVHRGKLIFWAVWTADIRSHCRVQVKTSRLRPPNSYPEFRSDAQRWLFSKEFKDWRTA